MMLEEASATVDGYERAPCNNHHMVTERCCHMSADTKCRSCCCRCAGRRRRASPLTCLAVCFLVLTYNLLGGLLFLALEGNLSHGAAEETAVAASKPNLSHSRPVGQELRSRTVEKLWSITEDLNILYKENWTKLAAKELVDFQKVLVKSVRSDARHERLVRGAGGAGGGGRRRWTFSGSFLYALTLITTIGDGSMTPSSAAGKLVSVVYACVGIPLVMLYLATLGEALARNFRLLYSRICPASTHSRLACLPTYVERDKPGGRTPFQAALNLDSFSGGHRWTCREHARVPISISFLVIVIYLGVGTLTFYKTEQWSLVDGCYFSFSSLATIGLGDLRPGRHASTVSTRAEDIAVGVCCAYILIGIVVIAMCFNLIQEDLGAALKSFSILCSVGGPKSRVIHTERPCEERVVS